MLQLEPAFLSAEEEAELVRKGQAGDHEARNKVIMGIYPMIANCAFGFAKGKRAKAEEYIHVAVQCLCAKFHKHKLEMGWRYSTYAMFWVRQSIMRAKYQDHMIRIPIHHILTNDPSHEAVREKYLPFTKQARGCLSADLPLSTDEGFSIKAMFEDRRSEIVHEAAARHELVEFVQAVLARLHPRYRQVLHLRMEELTLDQVAKVMGCTRERIRQLEAKAHQKFFDEASRLAHEICEEIEAGPERTVALRKLLESKDAAVRARLNPGG